MKGLGQKVSGALKKMMGGSSSRSRGDSSSYTPEPTPTPSTMDYEEEEQYEEMQAKPQAEVIEIDAEDAPYLDLRDDRERQGYAILKNRSFVHTRAFDPDLLIKTGMYEDFSSVWHAIGWDNFIPVKDYGSDSSPSNFFALFGRWKTGFIFDFLGKSICFLGKLLPATSITYSGQFILSKLGAVFSCQEFWGQILGQVVHGKFAPQCGDIHNPNLQLMHK